MGWFESDVGLNGDEPADAFGEAVHAVRSSPLPPSAEEVIASLIAALNCDGQREPFFEGKHLVAALEIRCGDLEVRVSEDASRPDVAQLMYHALDVASEAYRDSFGRPPTIAEILQYIEMYLEPEYSDGFVRNPAQWKLRDAIVVRSEKAKPADRLPCPAFEPTDASPKRKVASAVGKRRT